MTRYYNITGHILEISGEELGNIPNFSPFLFKSKTSPKPILSILLGENMVYKEMKLRYQFSVEMGSCEFYSDDHSYFFHWEQPDKVSWLMEIEFLEDKFIARTDMSKDTNPYILHSALWAAFGIAALHHQTISVHASAISYNNHSVLFLGESGTGKSTQSKLWLQHIESTELLNDDSPFIRIDENHHPIVWGSPWSGKTPCYKNKHTSIAAFIRLQQAPYNSIRRLKTIEAIGALQPSLPPIFAADPILSDLIHKCLSSILWKVPVYVLKCLPDKDAADLVYTTLKEDGWL